ncbi:leukotoxin LktA family filamentous adhesin [Luteibacter sp. PPL554]
MSKSPSRRHAKPGHHAHTPSPAAHPLHKLSVALASALSLGAPGAAWATSTVTSSNRLPGTTVISANGTTIDVNTVRQNGSTTAFNSFHDFQVGQGDTVNLHLPTGAANLVNLVDNQAIVNGTVNGMIGTTSGVGRVFFADPNGMVVGSTGTINVGALAIATPSQASMDTLTGEAATGGAAMTAQLLNGSIDHDAASVSIAGRINATSGVRIQAHAIDASGTIFVSGGATGTGLDTAVNTGGDGTVTVVHDDQGIRLVGQTLSLAQGSQVKAVDASGHPAADVTLIADAADSETSGQSTAQTAITLGGAIVGANVTVGATSQAVTDVASLDAAVQTLTGVAPPGLAKIGLSQLPIGVVAASSTAAVTLAATGSIVAGGDVVLQAATRSASSTSAVNDAGDKTLLVSGIYGETQGTTSATVAAGASIQAGGNVTVKALHSADLDISAKVSGTATVNASAAIGNVIADTRASVAQGATITGKDVSIIAHNTGSYEVASTVEANDTSPVGANAALLFVDSAANATNAANLGTTVAPIGSLTVLAGASTTKISVEAETSVGGEQKDSSPTTVVPSAGAGLMSFLEQKLGDTFASADQDVAKQTGETAQGTDADSGKGFFKGGVGVSLANVDTQAHASLAAGTVVKASGDVAVQSAITDAATTLSATTETESGKDNAATLSGSLALDIAMLHDDAAATIGSNADITAVHVGVGSDVSRLWALPSTAGLDEFANVPAFLKDIYGDLKNNGQPLATSYANATSATSDVGVAGALSFLSMVNDNNAWIGSGAKVNATATSDAPWVHSVALGNDAAGDALDPVSFGFAHAVGVAADTLTQTIDIAGNIDLLKGNGTSGDGSSASSVGGGVNLADYGDHTIAGIGDGATVTASAVGVDATDAQQMLVITPSAGRGSGVSGNVIFAMANIDNATHASIANTARIIADAIDVSAHQGAGIWSIAGAVAQGTSVGVGAGVAINNLTTDTHAYIGDNTADAATVDPTMAAATARPVAGLFAGQVGVQAATDGRSGAIAISGAQAKGAKDTDTGSTAGTGNTGGTGGTGSGTGGTSTTADDSLADGDSPGFLQTAQAKGNDSTSPFGIGTILGKLPVVGDLLGTAKKQEGSSATGAGSSDAAQAPTLGVGISGSATVDIGHLGTAADITGITVDRRNGTGGSDIDVVALNQTDLISASGAGALVTANTNGNTSAGLAGAVAYSVMANDTSATLTQVIAPHAGDVSVQALSGGSVLDLGLGLAYNGNGNQSDSAAAAGSFSIDSSRNSTTAGVTGSTLTAAGATSAMDVTAYDRTDIGVGGGAFSIGGSKGVGVAVTWSDIANDDTATITGGTLSGFGDLTVQALAASRLAAAAIGVSAAGGQDSLQLAGSFTINQVANQVSAGMSGATVANGQGDVTVNASGSAGVADYDNRLMANGHSTASFVDFTAASVDGSAPTGAAIFAVSGAVGGAGGNAAGLSFAINSIADTYAASIVGGSVGTLGNLAVTSADDTRIVAIAAGIGAAKGEFAGAGSLTANLINDTVSSTLGDTAKATATTANAASVKVDASNTATVDSLAGAVGIAPSGSSEGLAFAFNEIGSQTGARIVDAHVTTTGTTTATGCAGDAAATAVGACGSGTIHSAAVGVAGSDDLALTASFAVNDIGLQDTGALGTLAASLRQTFTTASVDASALNTAGLVVHAHDGAAIDALAGAVSGASQAAAGAGFALENIGNNTTASLTGTQFAPTGAVNVDADATGSIHALAIGGAVGGDIAVGGSLTANRVGNHTTATANGLTGLAAGARASLTALAVSATDAANIDAFAGGLGVGFEGAGIGAASSADTIANITHATLSNATLDVTGTTTVAAAATATIRTVAAAAAGGEGLGLSGALTVNTIDNDVAAAIDGGSQDDAGNTTRVQASDAAAILSMAGSLGVSAGAGLGAAIAVNDIGTRTAATIDGAQWHAKDVLVSAQNTDPNAAGVGANIRTLAAGVGGGSVGGAASAAVNVARGSVDASIVDGAQVTAENNIGVIASSAQGMDVLAGSAGIGVDAVGVGLGAVVNYLHDSTAAHIDGSTTQVRALAKDATDTLSVDSGTLAHAAALDTSSVHRASDDTAPDLTETTVTVSGLAINASSTQAVATLGASVAAAFDPVGSAALSMMADANVLGGTTTASITGAQVNQGDNSGAGATQAVDVRASSHAYDASFVAGVAAGATDVAATGAVAVNAFQRSTQATVQGADVTARGALDVDAEASQRSVAAVVGLAAAIAGGAGTGVVNVFDGTTAALVDRGTVSVGTLDVTANSLTQANMIGGAGAFGAAGVAGTFLLSSSQNTTTAAVGDTGADTTLHVSGTLDLESHSTVDLGSAMVSGAGAGGVAVAGMASVTVVGNTTTAMLERVALNQGDTGSGAVDVHAGETIDLSPDAASAAVALGGAGVGAAANVAVIESAVGASVRDSAVHATGAVDVAATSARTLDVATLSGALGAQVGISGALGLAIIGNGSLSGSASGDDPMAEFNKGGNGTLASLNALGGTGLASTAQMGGQLRATDAAAVNQATNVSLVDANGQLLRKADGTQATIGNSSLDAGSIAVTANGTTSLTNVVGNVAGGGVLGAGGAIAINVVDQAIGATVDNTSSLRSAGAVSVQAHANNGTARVYGPGMTAEADPYSVAASAYQGAAGFVGLGASVAISELNNQVSATLGGAVVQSTGITLNADDDTAVGARAGGLAAGGLAAGVVVSQADKHGSVGAGTAAQSSLTSTGTVLVTASSTGAVDARATAVSAGLLAAGNGSDANARDRETVSASLGNGTTLIGSQLGIGATANPDVVAKAFGVSVSGGIGIGASVATAQDATDVSATSGDDVTFVSDGTTVVQATNVALPGGGVVAQATGGAGGLLLGANASAATAVSAGSATAGTGSGNALPNGALQVLAYGTTAQNATATAGAAGFVGVGAAVGEADATLATSAYLGSGNTTAATRSGVLMVSASGTDGNQASATAGSGGAISGNAAQAITNDTATTNATIGTQSTLYAGLVSLTAQHQANYAVDVDATGAGIANASGAFGQTNALSDVAALVGANTALYATGYVDIASNNVFTNTGTAPQVQGGGGGVLSGAAATNSTTLGGTSSAHIGNDATVVSGLGAGMAGQLVSQYDGLVYTTGPDPFANPGRIRLGAGTQVNDTTTVSLDSGGAVAGSGVRDSLVANLADDVGTGDRDHLLTNGSLGIGSYMQTFTTQTALAHTYGGGAQGDARASTTINGAQNVSVGTGDFLLSFGQLNITAGLDPSGFIPTVFSADTVGQSYVRGVIAVATGSADTAVHSNASTTIATGAQVLGGADISLGSYRGDATVSAEGAGHGYELGFIPVTTTDSSATSDGAESLALAGTVTAGIYATDQVAITDSGLTHAHGAPLLYSNTGTFSPWNYIDQHASGLSQNTDSSGSTGVPVVQGAGQLNPPTGLAQMNGNGDGATAAPVGSSSTGTAPGSAPQGDLSVSDLLKGTTSSGNVQAYLLGSMFASGGNLTVHAGNLTGAGTLTANGGPSVTVANASQAYLVLNGIDVSANGGGAVTFTGGANQTSDAALKVNVGSSATAPSVTLANTYTGTMPSSPNGVTQGPAIFIGGDVNNLGGIVDITNLSGSVGQFAKVSAQQIKEYVPNGAVAVYLPSGTYYSGSDPAASWANYQINLGDANSAIMYALNAIYNGNNQYAGNDNAFNNAVYNQGKGALAFNNGTQGGTSVIAFGTCAPFIGNNTCGTNPLANSYDWGHDQSLPKLYTLATTKSYATDQTDSSATASSLVAQTIAVKAKYIDIDSTITAGRPTDYTITLGAGVQSFINAQAGDSGVVDLPTNLWCGGAAATCVPNLVQYDRGSKRIVINNVNASGGGFVSLDGGIVSTKAIGNIVINDGYGHVTINNQLGIPVQLADVNTGNNAVGELKITDSFKQYTDASGSWAQTLWYVDTRGQGTAVYNNANRATDIAHAVQGTVATDGTGMYYDPQAGLRYQWQQQVNLHRSLADVHSVANWGYVDATGTAVSTPQYLLVSSGIVSNPGDANYFDEKITASATYGQMGNGYASVLDVYYHGCGGSIGSGCHYGFARTVNADQDISHNGNGAGVWQYQYLMDAQLLLTSSVKADNRIHIAFQGNAAGQVQVNSNADVLLGGNIYNPSGSTSIDATQGAGGSILAGSTGAITSDGVILKAAGSIGNATRPLQLVMTGGTLSADAGAAGVDINAATALNLDHVTAGNAAVGYGDVTLNATGSVTSGTATAVTGRDITVNSGGAVGSAGQALVIAANSVTDANHGIDHGVVDVHAIGDVNLTQVGGDLRVGLIQSDGGAVNVAVPDGSIVDAAGTTAGQALSQAQLAQVRDTLHLTQADDTQGAIQAANRKRIEQTADGNYTQYQGLMANGSVVAGQFVLRQDSIALYRALASASLGHAASDAETLSYAASAYQTLDTYFTGLLGTGYAGTARFTAPVASFGYVATDAQVAAMTQDAYWNLGWLTSAVNTAAVAQTGAQTPPPLSFVGSAAPNIQGRDVTLSARQNIGSSGSVVSIDGQALIDGTVTDQQAAALATAHAAGDVTLVKDANGNVLRVDVKQTEPLFLTAGGTVSASTQAGQGGSIYLQANGDLNLGNIQADGDVRLAAVGNIAAVGSDPLAASITAGGNLTLLTGAGGSIGRAADATTLTAERAVTYAIGGTLIDATASQDVVLRSLGGDLRFVHVGANGDIVLDAGSHAIWQAQDGLAINGRSITLRAGGDVGFLGDGGKYLQVATGAGSLAGVIGGSARIDSPVSSAFNVGTLTVGGHVDLVSTGDLNAVAVSAGTGYANLSAGGNANVGSLAAPGMVTVTAVGEGTIGLLSGSDVSVATGGDIVGTAPSAGSANVTATNTATLHAGGGIGTPLYVTAPVVHALADRGDLVLALLGNLQAGDIAATLGSATVTGAAMNGTSMTAAQDLSLSATGPVTFNLLQAGQDASVQTGGDLTVATLAATRDATVQSGGAVQVATLGVGRDLTARAAGSLATTTLSAGRQATLGAGHDASWGSATIGDNAQIAASGNLDAGTTNVGGDVTLGAGGHLAANQTTVQGSFTATVGGDAALTTTNVTGDTTLHTTGDLSAGQTTVQGALAATVGGKATLATTQVTGDTSLTTGGDLTADQSTLHGGLDASVGGNAALTTTQVDGHATLAVTGALTSGTLAVGQDATLGVAQSVSLGQTTVGHDLKATLGSLVKADRTTVHHDATFDVTGDSTIGTLRVDDDLQANLHGNVQAGTLDVGHDATLQVGKDAGLATLTTGNDATLTVAGDLAAGTTAVGGNAQVNVQGNATADTTSVTGDATLGIGGTLAANQTTVQGSFTATVGGDAALTTTNVTGDTTLHTTGDLSAGQTTVQGALAATVGGKATLATTQVTGDTSLTTGGDFTADQSTLHGGLDASVGGNAALTATQVDGHATLAVMGALTSGTLTVGQDATLGVAQSASLGQTTVGHDLKATLGSLVKADRTTVHHDATFDVTGDSTIGMLRVDDDLQANLHGNVQAGTLDVGHDATLQVGKDAGLATLTTGNDATLTVAGDLAAGTTAVGGNARVNVQGNATADTTSVTGDATLGIGGTLAANQTTVQGNFTATVGGDAALTTTNVTGDTTLHTTGDLSAGQTTVQGALAATVGGNATLATTQVGASATVKVGGSLDSGVLGVGQDAVIAVAQNAHLATTTVGQDATLSTGQAMTLGTLDTGRDTFATAGDDLAFATVQAGRDAVLRSANGRVLGGDVTAGSASTVVAASDVIFGTDRAVGNALVTSGRDIQGQAVVVSQGDLTGTAARDLTLGRYDVARDVRLTSGRDMHLGQGRNGGLLTLGLAGNLGFGTIVTGGPASIESTQGSIHGGDLVTDTATLAAQGAVVLDTSHIGTRLNLAASDIDAHTVQTTTGKPLSMTLTGYHGGVARQIVIDLRQSDSWLIDRLATIQAVFDTSATRVTLPDGTVQGDMRLVTPAARVYMNNVSPTLADADIQYFEPDTRFTLALDGKAIVSDAYLTRYTVGYDVTTPNYIASHLAANIDYFGGSVLRYLGSTLTLHTDQTHPSDASREETAPGQPLPVGPVPTPSHDDNLVSPSVDGGVNLGSLP